MTNRFGAVARRGAARLSAGVALAALLSAASGGAFAQDIPGITVRPLDERTGGAGFVGPYGPDLPGVGMFAGRTNGPSPDTFDGDVPIPENTKLPGEYTYQDPLPPLDGWHGVIGPGIPF